MKTKLILRFYLFKIAQDKKVNKTEVFSNIYEKDIIFDPWELSQVCAKKRDIQSTLKCKTLFDI